MQETKMIFERASRRPLWRADARRSWVMKAVSFPHYLDSKSPKPPPVSWEKGAGEEAKQLSTH